MKLAVDERVPFADAIMILETTWKIFFKELTFPLFCGQYSPLSWVHKVSL